MNCNCADNSWYGPIHASSCPLAGKKRTGFSHLTKPTKRTPARRHHAFVGVDLQGDPCLYVARLNAAGTTGKYLSENRLRKLADRINNGEVSL